MKVSDKDFDRLFSAKLGDLEMEPSANVWSNIADELDGKKGKEHEVKGGLPFMKIAAGIVVLMAVGLYFIRPEQRKIELRASNISTDDLRDRVSGPTQPATVDYTESPVVADVKPTAGRRGSKIFNSTTTKIVTGNVDTAQTEAQFVAATDQSSNSNNVRMAQAASIQNQKDGLVPDVILSNPVKATTILPVKNTNPVMANVANTKTEPAKKHKIHSLGDLLNVVIAKVDKREDKLIEFTNTSDEDSFTVTGVNLGLLKAKKDK